jgi:hypothetical protein
MKTYMEILDAVDTAAKRFTQQRSAGYAAGFLQGTLGHALNALMKSNPEEAERLLDRLATYQPMEKV